MVDGVAICTLPNMGAGAILGNTTRHNDLPRAELEGPSTVDSENSPNRGGKELRDADKPED